MKNTIIWLSKYDAEYNERSKVLHIYKPMPVKEFMTLRAVLKPYMSRIKDIVIEGRD